VGRGTSDDRSSRARGLELIGYYGDGSAPKSIAPPAHEKRAESPSVTLGLLAPLTLLAAVGLVAVAAADGASRSGQTWGGSSFWPAIFICSAAFAYRLAGERAGRAERIGLVLVFGLWLFAVKLLRDPSQFTFADELVHSYNVDRIVSTHALFAPNPLLALTPTYPGLETTTAALRLLTGSSTFAAGITLLALSRVLMMLALFALFEFVSGSARLAGLAALVYTANANFVFFSTEFSYESFALPLAVFAAYAMARWLALKESDLARDNRDNGGQAWSHARVWGAFVIVTGFAIVVTHHLTSYVLIVFLLATTRAQREIRRLWKVYVTPFPFAAFMLVASLLWVFLVARSTWTYLYQPFHEALRSTLNTISGQSAPRKLFSAGAKGTDTTPTWQRLITIAAALLTAAGLPFGLRRVWKSHRSEAVYVVLAVAAAGYVLSLGLRLVPAAWEIANRASEFLFIGVGLVLALSGLENWRPRFAPRLGRLLLSLAFSILLGGGIIAGWSSNLLLSQTSAVSVRGTTIHPQGTVAAEWAGKHLGPGHRFTADPANARLLAADASEFAIAGTNPDVDAAMREEKLEGWHVRLLRSLHVQYVLIDQRLISEDALAGYGFVTDASPQSWRATYPPRSVHKFDRQPAVSRLFDSGSVVIYDIRGLVGKHAP
jgi:hypothetical protein